MSNDIDAALMQALIEAAQQAATLGPTMVPLHDRGSCADCDARRAAWNDGSPITINTQHAEVRSR